MKDAINWSRRATTACNRRPAPGAARNTFPVRLIERFCSLPALVLLAFACVSAVEAAPPARFAVEDVLTQVEQPMSLRFLPDGRMLLIQKKGLIRIVDTSTTPATSAVYLNLAAGSHPHGIDATQERGLIDIAIDPGFPAQPYIYLFYTPRTGPNGARARVARFTHRQNSGGLTSRADPASENILWQDTQGYNSCCHYGGGLDFGPDGKLWLTIGDHFQGSYAASLEHAGGGVIRINKNGTVPADNPWVDGSGPNHDALFAKGLRNPFRARWDLPTGRLFIGEVGGNEQPTAWEDLHVIEYDEQTGRFIDADFGTANDNDAFDGINFGWPTVEGLPPHNDFPGAEIDPIGEPIFAYRHAGNTAAINGGVIYRKTLFPTAYRGAYFYADSTRDFIRYIKFNSDGSIAQNPNPGSISIKNPDRVSYSFDPEPHGRIVALEVGPDGALYTVSFTDQGGAYGVPNPTTLGAVRRYVYEAANTRPAIEQFTVTPTQGQPPLAVEFRLRADDMENNAMTYLVRFGDGSSSGAQPLLNDTLTVVRHTYTSRGTFDVEVEVSDGTTTSIEHRTVQVGTPPRITSLTSDNSRSGASNTTFRFGDTLTFTATATDAEDGTLAGAAYTWTIWFVRPGNVHPALPAKTGVTSVDFSIPAQGQGFSGPVFYRVALSVTDSDGLTADATLDVYPEKSDISFRTVPEGIVVQIDGNTSTATPFVLDTLINFPHTITVPETVCLEGNQYRFSKWSNGPTTAQQTYTVPASDSTLTATYTLAGPCAGPPADGLVMRLTAESGVVLNNGGVAVWEDQSASRNHLAAVGRPLLEPRSGSTPAYIHFDGSDDALARTGFVGLPTGSRARSVFMVARYNAANASTGGWAGFTYGARSKNQAFGLTLTPTGTLGVQGWGAGNDIAASTPNVVIGRWTSHGATYNGSSLAQFVNGAPAGTASHTYQTGTSVIRLGEELGGGKNLDMDVAEILVYSRALSAEERDQVHQYFSENYTLGEGGGSNGAPTVTISAPANNAQLTSSDMPVTLTGTANDPEDGSLNAGIEWSSSIDGTLGTGGSIQADLSTGTHTITATATDAAGQADSASITVVVTGSSGGGGGLLTEGLVLHLESDLNVSTGSGSSVAAWLDQSGLGNDLEASGGPQLINSGTPTGRPAIRLDGANDFLERRHSADPLGGLPIGNENRTMFVVAKYNSTTAWGGASYGTASANRAFGLGVKHSSGELFLQGYGGGNDLVSTTDGVGAGWLVQSAVLNGGTATLYKNGGQIARFSHNYATTLTRLAVGQELGNRGFIGMEVAAILIYDRALGTDEREGVGQYLTNKYIGTEGGGGSPPVTSGLVLRLESGSGIGSSGGVVTTWSDASSSGNDLTASGGPTLVSSATPTGEPAVRLDGSNDRLERVHASNPLNNLPTGNANRTVFLVAKYNNAERAGGFVYGSASSNRTFGVGVRPAGELLLQGYGSANDLVSGTEGLGAGWLVQTAVLSNGTASLFKDVTQIAQGSHTYDTTLSRLVVGQEIGNTGYVGMEVAAALIYDRALSATEREQVIAYLNDRYIE